LDEMPVVYNTPEIRIDVPEEDKFAIVDAFRERLLSSPDRVIDVDGVRVVNDDGWWLARASNTQAAIIVRAEGRDEAALETLKNTIRSNLKLAGICAETF